MVTLGVALVLRELANRYSEITGGADGLQGIAMSPVLGLFRFDLYGHTGVRVQPGRALRLFVIAAPARPLAVRSCRCARSRATLARVGDRHSGRPALVATYTIAAFYAGVAGALLTQTTAFTSLDVFSFDARPISFSSSSSAASAISTAG
jgi:branched-chain amino acid transport system permease protein